MSYLKRTVALAALAGSLLFAASGAMAEPMMEIPHPGGKHMGMMGRGEPGETPLPPFLHGIRLSEAQRDKIFEIQYAQLPTLREKSKALHKAHEALQNLAWSGQYSDSAAQAAARHLADAMADIAALHAQADNRLYQVLTEEQRRQVAEHLAHRDQHLDHPMPPSGESTH